MIGKDNYLHLSSFARSSFVKQALLFDVVAADDSAILIVCWQHHTHIVSALLLAMRLTTSQRTVLYCIPLEPAIFNASDAWLKVTFGWEVSEIFFKNGNHISFWWVFDQKIWRKVEMNDTELRRILLATVLCLLALRHFWNSTHASCILTRCVPRGLQAMIFRVTSKALVGLLFVRLTSLRRIKNTQNTTIHTFYDQALFPVHF